MLRRITFPFLFGMVVLSIGLLQPSAVNAQFGGGGFGGQGGGGQGGGGFGGGGGGGNQGGGGGFGGGGQAAGVIVDAEGVLRVQTVNDPTGQLTLQRIQAARAALDPKVAARNPMRKISLNRLERAIEAQLAEGRKPTDEMRYLAGLIRVQYVFYFPESRDIVIAGPAEGWAEDLTGRVRGITSGRPVVELQDLVTALRAFPPNAEDRGVIGCSIDPTQEGLARMQDFLRQVGSRATPRDTQFIVQGLRTSLGMQTVRVMGIPPNTHFAQVMVEADYRMKLIGIGLEKPAVKMASYVDGANPASVSRNALQRWYFTPDYNCVKVSGDEFAMELVGNGVKLIGEDELVGNDGTRRQAAGNGDRASKAFVNGFTQKYPELADRIPVYAQLRNLIDLAIAAAFIQQQNYYAQAEWTMPTLGSEERFKVETYVTPVQVETAVNSVWKGNHLMTPIGGGVEIQAARAIETSNRLVDEDGKLNQQHKSLDLKQLPAGRWWWD